MDNNQRMNLDGDAVYPIRHVADVTGVKPVTLRAWERRHGLIKPHRTPSGHRLYTATDIDRVQRILALLEQGISIGQVGAYLARSGEAVAVESDLLSGYLAKMEQAVTRFDEAALDAIYNNALSRYPTDLVTGRILAPLLRKVGERWYQAEGGIAEEHFLVNYLRNKIGARLHHLGPLQTGPALVTACLPGEQHQIGLLLFGLTAAHQGLRCITLGADVPFEETSSAAERTHCAGIVLSASLPPADHILESGLHDFARNAQRPVFLGGELARTHGAVLREAGIVVLSPDYGAAVKEVLAEILRVPASGR